MTDEEIAHEEAMDDMVREIEKNRKNPKLKTEELRKVFPEIMEIAPIKVKEIEDKISRLNTYCQRNKILGNTLEDLWEQERRDNAMQELRRMLRRFKVFIPSEPMNGVSEAEIEAAREYPILDLIDEPQRSGSTYKIHCPLHEERTPSCKIYTKSNDFWCFGCNQGGSTIDLVMARDDVDFITAVRQLAGG